MPSMANTIICPACTAPASVVFRSCGVSTRDRGKRPFAVGSSTRNVPIADVSRRAAGWAYPSPDDSASHCTDRGRITRCRLSRRQRDRRAAARRRRAGGRRRLVYPRLGRADRAGDRHGAARRLPRRLRWIAPARQAHRRLAVRARGRRSERLRLLDPCRPCPRTSVRLRPRPRGRARPRARP